jgi:hypothetical protein
MLALLHCIFQRLLLTLLLVAALAQTAIAQGSLQEAVAVGPGGLPPLEVASDSDAALVWESYGLQFRGDEGRVYVASLRADGPAATRMGFEIGDIVVGDMVKGFRSTVDPDAAHSSLATVIRKGTETRELTLMMARHDTLAQREVRIPPPAELVAAPGLLPMPPALHHLRDDPAMTAIWRHEAQAIDTPDLAEAAQRILFALSHHVAGCAGPDAVEIPIQVVMTTTTTDGLGAERGRETDTFGKVLKVRPEFAGLARRTVAYYSDSVMGRRFTGVRDLISQDTCDGPRLRRLEEGLAKAAGVTLPPLPVGAEANETMGADWRGFVAECTAASYPSVTNNEAGAAIICTIYEALGRNFGDPEIYAELRREGMVAGANWPSEFKARFNSDFDKIYRDPDRKGEVWERVETYRRANGL